MFFACVSRVQHPYSQIEPNHVLIGRKKHPYRAQFCLCEDTPAERAMKNNPRVECTLAIFSVTWRNTPKQTRLMVSAYLAFINFRLSGSQHCFALQRLPISRCHNPLLLICEQNQTKPPQTWGEVSGKSRSLFLALVSAIFTLQQERHVLRNLDFLNPDFSNLQSFPTFTEKKRLVPKNWDSAGLCRL